MNKNKPIVSFIIPALNEELNLPPLFERLLALEKKLCLECEIIVIDDSSQDRTLQVAQDAAEIHPQIRSLSKPLPHGLGCSVRAGLELARGKLGVVVMADGVDPLEEAVPEFCEKILVEKCHLVLLSRYIDPINSKTIPFSYRFYHSLFRFFTFNLLGIPHPDTTYAFRAF
ncbi:MAG: glycosyltransferase family 2 protein, partial [Planctomycetota bacterium]